jgi:hypothetical protein
VVNHRVRSCLRLPPPNGYAVQLRARAR